MPRNILYHTATGKILGSYRWDAPTPGPGQATALLSDREWEALDRETQRYDATAGEIRPATRDELDDQDAVERDRLRARVEDSLRDAVADRDPTAVLIMAVVHKMADIHGIERSTARQQVLDEVANILS